MNRLTLAAWSVIITLTLITGSVTAQDPSPAGIVQDLADAGIIDSASGELAATDRGATVDLSGQGNRTSWRRALGIDAYGDMVIGATVRFQAGSDDDICGFVFHQQDDTNYYMAGISQNGRLHFTPTVDGNAEDGVTRTAGAIQAGDGAENELVIVAASDTITMRVNGEPVGTFEDATFSSGKVGVAMTTHDASESAACRFDNIWLWDLGSAASQSTPATGKPYVAGLAQYDQDITTAVAELEATGIIPSGGQEIFREPMAFFEGNGYWFTPLASYNPHTHVVMAGELHFTPSDSGEMEACTLLARTNIQGRTATSFLEVGLASGGAVIVVDTVDNEVGAYEPAVALGVTTRPQHILFTAFHNQVNVWLNGELVIENMLVSERNGTYGIALVSKGASGRCEGHNIWAWQVDDVVSFGDQCGVRAGNTVNLRGGPGTTFDIAGTLAYGQTAIIVGQTTAGDGYVWYKLDNDAWVRSDVVAQGGDCTSIPQLAN